MSNPYINIYSNQIGGNLSGFQGIRYQRGYGFFGRIFSGLGSLLKGILPSVAKSALPSAMNFAQDVISGENVGQSAKKRIVEAGRSAADETLTQLKTRLQKGKGIFRFKNRNKMQNIKTTKRKRTKIKKINKRRRHY